ncbi:MAG TPA: TonB-dependent receptor [Rhizomicrobium sp.]|nr:TonB-dependent receptor [Rhizomicrobium sp.]
MQVSPALRASRVMALVLGTTALFSISQAVAEDASPIEEVVVTAQKIEQPLSKVPVTISALSGDQLADHNYTDLEDFKGLVPGLQVNNYAGQARTNIRGIGMNSLSFGVDSQVAFNFDGVYVSSARMADQALLDIDRIEVVRGPQGTLYGRNATGGAINVISKKPTDEFEGSAQLKVGNYDEIGSQVVVSGPVADTGVLGRFAFSSEDHAGYSLNLYNGEHYDDAHTRTARGTLLFDFGNGVTLDLVADYHQEADTNHAGHLLGLSPGFPVVMGVVLGGSTVPLDANGNAIDPRLLNINTVPENKQKSGGILAELNWKMDDRFALKSITAYRREGIALTFDFDQTPIPIPTPAAGKDFEAYEGERQVSEELQFIGNLDWVSWVAGLYYFHDDVDPGYFYDGVNFSVPAFPFLGYLQLGGTTATDAYAAFGQASFKLTDRLTFDVGLRYSYEERSSTSLLIIPIFSVTGSDAKSASFHDVSPKFSLDYQWTDGLMTYVTIGKGFQSGGFDISASPPLMAFQPETVWDYEGGIKYRNDWLSADISAYHYNYTNLQVAQIINGLPTTTNAADSIINGVEASVTVVPMPGLAITENFAFTDAYFTRFTEPDTLTGILTDLSGNQLPGATRYSSNLAIQYTIPIGDNDITLMGEWNWHDRLYYTEFNSNQLSQPPVSTFNASARYTFANGKWSAEIFGKNLSDELIISQAWITGAGYGSMALGQIAPPRTFGAIVRYQFN